MAIEQHVTADDHVFIGDDSSLEFAIYSDHAQTTPVDVSSYTLEWTLRLNDDSPSVLITKTLGSGLSIAGTYNSNPDVNTQRIVLDLDDTDTYDEDASPPVYIKAGSYRHSLKRTNPGSEKVLFFGDFEFLQGTVR